MDFTFTPEQDEAAELAARILADRTTNERMKAVEQAGDRFDGDLWARAGPAPACSGSGCPRSTTARGSGCSSCARVLVEVGRTVAPVPLAAHGPASRLIAEVGTDDQRRAWLPGAATGERVLTAALAEERAFAPERPATLATPDGDGWRLTGSKTVVPAGTHADAFLVPAETSTGVAVFLVTPGDAGRPGRGPADLRRRHGRPARPGRRRGRRGPAPRRPGRRPRRTGCASCCSWPRRPSSSASPRGRCG